MSAIEAFDILRQCFEEIMTALLSMYVFTGITIYQVFLISFLAGLVVWSVIKRG